jgi:RNase P subunit RPR2
MTEPYPNLGQGSVFQTPTEHRQNLWHKLKYLNEWSEAMFTNQIDAESLVDIHSVVVNKELPIKERINDFINQIKNPYCYKCGKVTVLVSFANTNETLEDRLESYLSML